MTTSNFTSCNHDDCLRDGPMGFCRPPETFPQVSCCHHTSLRLCSDEEGTCHYECTNCNQPCDAIADEELEEKPEKGNSEIPKIANSSEKPNCSPPPDAKEEKIQNIKDRLAYFYLQTDGTMKFPNSVEGDILRLVYEFLTPHTP